MDNDSRLSDFNKHSILKYTFNFKINTIINLINIQNSQNHNNITLTSVWTEDMASTLTVKRPL